MDDRAFASATELTNEIRDRRIGCVELLREVPVGLTDIALTFELDTDADAATMQRLVEMSERFCVIYQTLRTPPGLSVTHRIVDRT
jgi:hypothetical protein